ncbi:unnamed protein product, partial [Clonostachys chloroleuca]
MTTVRTASISPAAPSPALSLAQLPDSSSYSGSSAHASTLGHHQKSGRRRGISGGTRSRDTTTIIATTIAQAQDGAGAAEATAHPLPTQSRRL